MLLRKGEPAHDDQSSYDTSRHEILEVLHGCHSTGEHTTYLGDRAVNDDDHRGRPRQCVPAPVDTRQMLLNWIFRVHLGWKLVEPVRPEPDFLDLGTAGNIVSGLVGGGLRGQIVSLLLPTIMAAAQSGNFSVSGIVSHAIPVARGALLTAVIGPIKNKAAA